MHQPSKRDAKLRLAIKLASPNSKSSAPADSVQTTAERVLYQVDRLRRLIRHRELCRVRSWQVADRTLATRQSTELRELQYLLTSIAHAVPPPLPTVTAGNVYRDLLALDGEFDDFAIADDLSTVSIVTEPIILDGIALGRFRIELDLSAVSRGRSGSDCLRAEALDPNPASSNDDVTHPHVQGGRVCLGEGGHLFQIALKEGRLYDAFLVVNQILKTYNDASPYVSLGNWNGSRCDDCDDVFYEDDLYTCHSCDGYICSECKDCCVDCGETHCRRCLTLENLDLLCSSCLEERQREAEEEDEEPEPLTPEETAHVPATT